MKKLTLLFIAIALSGCVFAQSIQPITEKKHKANGGFILAGAGIIAGAVLGYVANNETKPVYNPNTPIADYESAVKMYDARVKSMRNASSLCYGISGVGMIIGVIIKF